LSLGGRHGFWFQASRKVHLVRGIESRGPRQAIVRAILRGCVDMGIDVIVEGIETPAEYQWLLEANV
jgi:EAL domain-containing protein (putative c-di-GMP-specific phosphodiesterase class I)